MKADVYERITGQFVSELEKGVRPWFKPWNAEHAAGRITRPLRSNGIPYRGINVLMLWSEAMTKGFAAPIWMTFKQALESDIDGESPVVRSGVPPVLSALKPGPTRRPARDRRPQPERSQ